MNPMIENSLATAIYLFERSLRYHPDHRAFWGLGLVYQHQRRFEESVTILRQGIAHHPASVDLHMVLANSLMRLDRYPEARRCLEAFPDHPQAVEQLMRCCRFMGDREGEQAWIDRLASLQQR
jgi:tetratricopeptide (TPR) repeat protein